MKRTLSLKLSIVLAFLLVSLILVLGYSYLSVQFFFRGMDSIIASNMQKAAQTYVSTLPMTSQLAGREFSGYFISPEWEQQPEEIKQIFVDAPKGKAQLAKYVDSDWFSRPDAIYFAIRLKINGQRLYISRKSTMADSSPLVGRFARANRDLIFTLSISIAIALASIAWLLLRYISRPVTRLTHWTRDLSVEKLAAPTPDFVYPELNEMATLIRRSLTTVHNALEREQKFLRFTSHELRTPLSIIRNNVELLHKIEQKQPLNLSGKEMNVINRIDRASLTMQHLTETLLWLSRDDDDALPRQSFRLDLLIQQLVDDMSYLLNNKSVTIESSLSPIEITHSAVAARIVIGNLIRNAFQHTWQGEVIIKQQQSTLTIVNHCRQFTATSTPSDQGFGLGLQLTEKLCQKLNWSYHNTVHENGHTATLQLANLPD